MGKSRKNVCGRTGLLLICATLLGLGGCGKTVETWAFGKLQENLEETVGYKNEEVYQEYLSRGANGTLSEVNVEQPEALEEVPDRTGKIRVTFAKNNLLDILYFTDAACTNPIDTENCYLNPADKIYASEPRCKSEYGNMYSFLEYRVYEVDSTGKRMQVEGVCAGEENLVYQIPMLMEGKELSIVPVGRYTDRTITLHDYTINEKGEEIEEAGTWTVNNMECQKTEYTFSSLVTYQISYQYDPEEYYFVDSTPKCYYPKTASEGKGNIIFHEEKNFLNPNESFFVQLHKYLSAEITNSKDGGIVSVSVGNKEIDIWQNIKKKEQKEKIILDTLKCGDIVTIITSKECKLVPSSAIKLDSEQPKKLTNGLGYKYTFTVPDVAEGNYKFSVKEWIEKDVKLEVGKMEDAVEKVLTETFKEGESLLTVKTDNNNYTLKKCKEEKSIPLAESEDLVISISEKIPKGIKVHIVADGNSKKVFDINKDTPKEQYEIKLSYEEVNSLTISVKNEGLMKNAEITSNLSVTLDKAVGTNPVFTLKQMEGETMVAATGYGICGKELYKGKVDANKNIVLSGQMQLDVNTAIKLEITKAVGGTEIRYCTGTDFEEIITTKKGDEYCGDIDINISLVAVVAYKPCTSLENGTIELRFADTDEHKIRANEFLEEDRKVMVTMKSKNGYYIEGGFGYKISSDGTTYEKEMKFSEYVSDIEKIITKNPMKKLVVVTLNVTSPKSVGKVSYNLNRDDSKIVSTTGTYSFKEGDEIEITWDVSGTGYKLVNEWFTVPGVNWTPNSKTEKKTVTIKITPELGGSTIYAENIEAFTKLKLEKEED